MPIWDDVVPPSERWAYKGDFAKTTSRGQRPALLVVDVRLAFAHEQGAPISTVLDDWLAYWGEEFWANIAHVESLIRMARCASIPVIYSDMRKEFQYPRPGVAPDLSALGPRERSVASLLPRPGDVVIRKHKPSAFFGTLLLSHLVSLGVDTLIVAGCATSNCVRATVNDASSYDYHVMIVEECTFDRRPTLHKLHMFEMDNRMGEVVSLATVNAYLQGLAERSAGH
jgi:maleamate amidohydrolase